MNSTAATERWQPVQGYEDLYEVSDQGRVRSLDRIVTESTGMQRRKAGRVLQPIKTGPQGRGTVYLCRGGIKRRRYISHVVLETFVGPRPSGLVACHNNGGHLDDRLSNLRWDTYSANCLDTVRHGRHSHAMTTVCPRGHGLFPPNLVVSEYRRTGTRDCLACNRARSNYWDAVRRGDSAPDLRERADSHYKRIMQMT